MLCRGETAALRHVNAYRNAAPLVPLAFLFLFYPISTTVRSPIACHPAAHCANGTAMRLCNKPDSNNRPLSNKLLSTYHAAPQQTQFKKCNVWTALLRSLPCAPIAQLPCLQCQLQHPV